MELVLFRVLQESLTNIHRHAKSKTAKVRLRVDEDKARLVIVDNGKGFPSANGAPKREGVGIAGMRGRVRELGGAMEVTSGPGGTTVHVVLPLRQGVEVSTQLPV